jgi:hypothetical protein
MKTKIIIAISFLSLFFMAGTALAGFGISPPNLINKNLVPGSNYEQTIYLVQNDPAEVLHATVSVDAGKANNWIKIENGNNFDIPKGIQQFPMKVSVAVPSDAELGHYAGSITVNTQPATVLEGGVRVILGGQININLDVTSIKVSDFSIQNFQIADVKKGSPVKLVIKIKNDGNVENGPTKASVVFFDQYHSKQLSQSEKDIVEKVQPFKMQDISIDFPNDLDVGSYWADVKIYSGDKAVVDNKMVFSVVNEISGNNNQAKSVFFSYLPKISFKDYLIASAVIIIIIVIVVLIFIFIKIRRKNKIKIHHGDKDKK